MKTLEANTEHQDWCFTKEIYFYAYSANCPTGFCKIVKWVKGAQTIGQKLFPLDTIENTIDGLYKQIYNKNFINP